MGPVTTQQPTLRERTQGEGTDQLAPVRLERGSEVAPAVEALAPGQPVPPGTGTSTRHLPSWPRESRHNGSAKARRSPTTTSRATMFAGGLAGLLMVSAAIAGALLATKPSLIPGWKALMIASESMAPSSPSGDGVLAAPSDSIGVGAGTVSVFDGRRGSGLVTHRTVGPNAGGTYRTHGGANGQARSTPLTADQVVGVGRLLVPLMGISINRYSAGAWVELAAWLTVLLLAVLVIRDAVLERYDPWVGPEVWVNASG